MVDSPFLKIYKEAVELPNGEILHEYYILDRPGWVAIWCEVDEGEVVLTRQYKHGIGKTVMELPAGSIEKGETPLDCAMRELLEETGYIGLDQATEN